MSMGPDVPSQNMFPEAQAPTLSAAPGANLQTNNWMALLSRMAPQPPQIATPTAPVVSPAQAIAYNPVLPTASGTTTASSSTAVSPATQPVKQAATTPAPSSVSPKKASAEKFDNFLKILQGVSSLAGTTAAIKSAFSGPARASGGILARGGGAGLAAAPGASIGGQLGAGIQPGATYSPAPYNPTAIQANTGTSDKNIAALLKALSGG